MRKFFQNAPKFPSSSASTSGSISGSTSGSRPNERDDSSVNGIISYLSTAARLRFSKPAHSYYYLKYATFSDLVERNAKSDSSASPKSVPVQTAYELLKRGHRFLEVRTHDEFLAGHPSGAINIAYMLKVGQEMAKNSEFVKEVSSQFEKDEKLLLGCKSGRRSLLAAKELQSFGFTSVTDVVAGGYIAWKESGLPINH